MTCIQSGQLVSSAFLQAAVLSQAQQLTTVTATPADVKPTVTDLPISGDSVTDLHLRPLFTTTIRLPEPVTSVAVGAPPYSTWSIPIRSRAWCLLNRRPKSRQRATW